MKKTQIIIVILSILTTVVKMQAAHSRTNLIQMVIEQHGHSIFRK